MASSTGYTTGVRAELNKNGISNDRISYDPSKGVMIDGASFYKPEKNYNGTTFTSADNFKTAWDNYNKTQQQPAQAQPTQQPATYNPYANNSMIQNNPYSSQADQVIQDLLNYGKNQQNFDPYSSSQYQAAQAQAQRAAGQNTRAAQEAYGSAGFGRSTALGERVAGINNDATEYLMTQVLPQIEAQESARRQQEYNNLLAALNPLLGQQDRADNLVQQDFNNRVTEGQMLGSYKSPELAYWENALTDYKGNTERDWAGLSGDERTARRTEGDRIRSIIDSLGGNSSLFGADVTAQNAGQNRGRGVQTLAGQAQDYAQTADQRDYDRGVVESDRNFNEGVRQFDTNLEYTQGRDAVKDAQWEQEFQRILKQDGVQEALAWAANSVARMNAGTSAGNLALSREEFNYRKDQDKLESKTGTAADLTAKDSANNLIQFKTNIQNLSYQDALMYLQNPAVSSMLSDADYKKAIELLEDIEGQND